MRSHDNERFDVQVSGFPVCFRQPSAAQAQVRFERLLQDFAVPPFISCVFGIRGHREVKNDGYCLGLELETSLQYRLQKASHLDCNMGRNVDAAEKRRIEEETRGRPKRDDKYKTVTAK